MQAEDGEDRGLERGLLDAELESIAVPQSRNAFYSPLPSDLSESFFARALRSLRSESSAGASTARSAGPSDHFSPGVEVAASSGTGVATPETPQSKSAGTMSPDDDPPTSPKVARAMDFGKTTVRHGVRQEDGGESPEDADEEEGAPVKSWRRIFSAVPSLLSSLCLLVTFYTAQCERDLFEDSVPTMAAAAVYAGGALAQGPWHLAVRTWGQDRSTATIAGLGCAIVMVMDALGSARPMALHLGRAVLGAAGAGGFWATVVAASTAGSSGPLLFGATRPLALMVALVGPARLWRGTALGTLSFPLGGLSLAASALLALLSLAAGHRPPPTSTNVFRPRPPLVALGWGALSACGDFPGLLLFWVLVEALGRPMAAQLSLCAALSLPTGLALGALEWTGHRARGSAHWCVLGANLALGWAGASVVVAIGKSSLDVFVGAVAVVAMGLNVGSTLTGFWALGQRAAESWRGHAASMIAYLSTVALALAVASCSPLWGEAGSEGVGLVTPGTFAATSR